uniref:Uncharacterized protein n=2 Tax=Spongospora subterranea TaxID=70186 RepID=A0A0H5R982_9EUKA|eukprot:CRZ04964.1 hypothetical protein [Spongospora subterranea]
MIDKHAILAQKLVDYGFQLDPPQKHNMGDDRSGHFSRADQRAKLRRLEPIVRPTPLGSSQLHLQAQGMTVLDGFRSQIKLEQVRRLLHQQTRCVRSRLGQAVLFCTTFTNPYPHNTLFILSIANDPSEGIDGGLRLIMSGSERRHCQRLFQGDPGSHIESSMVSITDSQNNKVQFELGGGEKIQLWFCWQSFHPGNSPSVYTELGDFAPSYQDQNARPIFACRERLFSDVNIERASNLAHISLLKIQVDPLPFTVDETFYFDYFNNEILKGVLPMKTALISRDPDYTADRSDKFSQRPVAKVRCTNDRVAFEFHDDDEGGARRLSFRYACGEYPDIAQFYLLLLVNTLIC